MKPILLVLSCLVLCGCKGYQNEIRMKTLGHIQPGATSRLSVGMPKEEVIRLFGPPESMSATADGEAMFYIEERPWWNWVKVLVTVKDGRVSSFGEAPK